MDRTGHPILDLLDLLDILDILDILDFLDFLDLLDFLDDPVLFSPSDETEKQKSRPSLAKIGPLLMVIRSAGTRCALCPEFLSVGCSESQPCQNPRAQTSAPEAGRELDLGSQPGSRRSDPSDPSAKVQGPSSQIQALSSKNLEITNARLSESQKAFNLRRLSQNDSSIAQPNFNPVWFRYLDRSSFRTRKQLPSNPKAPKPPQLESSAEIEAGLNPR